MSITKVSGHVIEPTTNIQAGIITATRFDGPIGTGSTDGNFSGIVTTSQLNVTGVTTFSGDVNFPGATSGRDILWDKSDNQLEFKDNTKIVFGNSSEFGIWAASGASYIKESGSGTMVIQASNLVLETTTGTDYFYGIDGGTTALCFGGNAKLETTNTGAVVTGILTATDFSGAAGGAADFPNGLTGTTATFSGNVTIGGTLTYEDVTNIDSVGLITARSGVKVSNDIKSSDDDFYVYSYKGGSDGQPRSGIQFDGTNSRLRFHTATQERLRISSTGMVGIGTTNPSGNLHVQTTGGTYDPLVIERKGSANWGIKPYANTLFFRSNSDGSNSFNSRDRFGIAWDGTDARGGDVQFYGTAAGVTSCTWDASANTLIFNDDVKAAFGNGSDLNIYFDGTRSYIKDNVSNDIRIASNDVRFRTGADGATTFSVDGDGATALYHNQNAKLVTTGTGISVTGEVATSQDYPTIRPTLDLNFAATKTLDPRITYRRTGPASYTNEFGRLVLVGDNVPRFDHDPDTRECKGLLIEAPRTNLMKAVTHPHLPKSTYSSNSNGSIVEVSDDVLAPDGSAYTLKLHWTNYTANQNGYRRVGNQTEIGTLAAGTYGFSFFVKRGTDGKHNMEEFLAGTATGIGDAQYHFTIQEFSPASSANVKLCNNSAVTIDKYPDGWYRLSGTITTSGSSNPDNTGASYYVLGNSSFKTFFEAMPIYHWGFQLEVGGHPTSYIGGTVSETTTRGYDFVKIDGTEFTDFYNQSEGTLVSEFTMNMTANSSYLTSGAIANINALSSGSYANSIMFMEMGTANGYFGRVYKSSNGTQLSSGSSVIADLMGGAGPDKVSFAWSDTVVDEGLASYWNGSVVNTSNTETNTPTNMTELRIGHGWGDPSNDTSGINAHIKRLSYYPKRLPNSQLATLTA